MDGRGPRQMELPVGPRRTHGGRGVNQQYLDLQASRRECAARPRSGRRACVPRLADRWLELLCRGTNPAEPQAFFAVEQTPDSSLAAPVEAAPPRLRRQACCRERIAEETGQARVFRNPGLALAARPGASAQPRNWSDGVRAPSLQRMPDGLAGLFDRGLRQVNMALLHGHEIVGQVRETGTSVEHLVRSESVSPDRLYLRRLPLLHGVARGPVCDGRFLPAEQSMVLTLNSRLPITACVLRQAGFSFRRRGRRPYCLPGCAAAAILIADRNDVSSVRSCSATRYRRDPCRRSARRSQAADP